MPNDVRGTDWLEALAHADVAREWWRNIVWASRTHYLGMRKGQTAEAGTTSMVSPYNKHRSVEDFLKASLEPASLSFRLTPTDQQFQQNARACQAMLNFAMRRSAWPKRIGSFITFGRVDGVGIAKTEVGIGGGWTPSIEETGGTKTAVPGAPSERHSTGTLRTEDQLRALRRAFISQSDLPETEPVDAMDYLLATGSVVPEHAAWQGHRVRLRPARVRELVKAGYYRDVPLHYDAGLPSTQEWLQRQKLFAGTASGLRPSANPKKRRSVESDEEDPDTLWELWEIHDRVEDRIYHVLPGTEQLLRDMPREIDGEPYTFWRPSGTEYDFWAIPDVWQYMPAQVALDNMLNFIVQHVARHAKTVVMHTGNVSPETVRAIARAANGEFVKVADLAAIQPLVTGTLPPDVFKVLGLLSQVIHEVAGVSPLSTGIPTQPGASATEVVTLQANTNVRLARMQRLLNVGFEQIGRRTLNLLGLFAAPETVVPILGVDIPLWENWRAGTSATIKAKELTGTFEFEVILGQGNQVDPMRHKQALDDWNLLSPSPWFDAHGLALNVAQESNLSPNIVRTAEQVQQMQEQQMQAAMAAQANEGGPAVGRSAPGATKAPESKPVSKDQRRRTGAPKPANDATDMMRGGAPR